MSSKRRERPGSELVLQLDEAATPERVAATARLFAELVGTAGVDLGPDSVTMVVGNFRTRAGLRGWDAEGARFVGDVVSTVRNPAEAVRARPRCAAIAQVFAKEGPLLQEAGAQVFSSRRSRRGIVLDRARLSALEGASRIEMAAEYELHPIVARGSTEFRTPILRVGRTNHEAPLRARVMIDGRPQDVDVVEQAFDDVVQAMKNGSLLRVTVRARWTRAEGGAYKMAPSSIEIVDTSPVKTMSGMDFMSALPTLSRDTSDLLLGLLSETREEQDD